MTLIHVECVSILKFCLFDIDVALFELSMLLDRWTDERLLLFRWSRIHHLCLRKRNAAVETVNHLEVSSGAISPCQRAFQTILIGVGDLAQTLRRPLRQRNMFSLRNEVKSFFSQDKSNCTNLKNDTHPKLRTFRLMKTLQKSLFFDLWYTYIEAIQLMKEISVIWTVWTGAEPKEHHTVACMPQNTLATFCHLEPHLAKIHHIISGAWADTECFVFAKCQQQTKVTQILGHHRNMPPTNMQK